MSISYRERSFPVSAPEQIRDPQRRADILCFLLLRRLFLCLDEIAKELSNNTYIYRNKQEIVSIPYADILTFSSRLHYVDILTVDGKCYEQMSTLNKIIVHLPSEFIRTHRSYIVNMAHIYRITSGTIELSNHLTTQIARSYSKDVISAFAKYTTRFDTSGDFE